MVLALGALGFGVVAQLRISDLTDRLDAAEARLDDSVLVDDGEVAQLEPTTTVPEPTATTGSARRPSDVGEARAGIVTAFETVYRGSAPIEERLALIDDPSGVEEALTAAARSPLAGVVSTSAARVDDVAFTSAGAATVSYTVTAEGSEGLVDRLGTSLAIDGTWTVTRATVCGDLSELGFPCGA